MTTTKEKEEQWEPSLTTEDFFRECERIHASPWYVRLWYYRVYYLRLPWHTLRDTYYRLQNFWQRGRRGWAVCDTWNADVYLAQVISEMCQSIQAHSYGTPYPFYQDEEHGDEQWRAYLGDLAQAFGDYAAFMGDDGDWGLDSGDVRYQELVTRMRPLFDHWSAIND